MKSGESSFFYFIPEIIQCLPGFFSTSPETLHQFFDTENGENRLPVNLKIIRLFKILVNNPINNYFIILPIYLSIPKDRIVIAIAMIIPIVVFYIMVGPHDIKLHFMVIFCFQKSIIQGTF